MSGLHEIKDVIESLGKAHKDYRDVNDERIAAMEKGDTARAAELDVKLSSLDSDVTKFSTVKDQIEREVKFMQERIEELESRQSEPGATKAQAMHDTHGELFEKSLRGQFANGEDLANLKNHERAMIDTKSVTIATGAAGGFAVPESISSDIEKLERKLSPVRDLIKVVPVGTSDYKELISIGGAASGWVGESGSRSETATSLLREVTPTHGELYAYPQASEWSLDDAFFSIADWLRDETAEEFAYQEGVAVISGNGTNKPTGMLDTVPVSTADAASPLRAAAAYQFVASAASPDALLADTLIDVIYALNKKYRAGSTFVFNSVTAGVIRKFKDSNNQYLWAPGLTPGEPSQLLGYPTATWEDMQDVGANQHPVAFGNFKRGYLLADRVGMRITVDQVTNPGFIRYYIRRREGGIVLNNDAIKWIKTT